MQVETCKDSPGSLTNQCHYFMTFIPISLFSINAAFCRLIHILLGMIAHVNMGEFLSEYVCLSCISHDSVQLFVHLVILLTVNKCIGIINTLFFLPYRLAVHQILQNGSIAMPLLSRAVYSDCIVL